MIVLASTYFDGAQLSLATYADLNRGMSRANYVAALQIQGDAMTLEQALEFADVYGLIDQFSDPDSGFSATIFEKDDKVFLSIRGSDLRESGVRLGMLHKNVG